MSIKCILLAGVLLVVASTAVVFAEENQEVKQDVKDSVKNWRVTPRAIA